MRVACVFLLAAAALAEDWGSLYGEGAAALGRGEYETAITLLQRADRALPDGAPADDILNTKAALGTAYTEAGRPEEALAQFLEGRERMLDRRGRFSIDFRIMALRAGTEAMRLSRLPQAESLLCECLESLQLGSDRDDPLRRLCVSRLAALAARRGNFQLAQDLARLSVEGAKRRRGDGEVVASILTTFGEIAREGADYQAAVIGFRNAIAVWMQAEPSDLGFSAVMRASLARALAEAGERDAAGKILDALLPSIGSAPGYTMTVARARACGALLELQRNDEAASLIEGLRRAAWPRLDAATRAEVLLDAARLEVQTGHDEAAVACFRDLLELLAGGETYGLLAGRAHSALAMTLARLGRHEEAVVHAEQALKIKWRGLRRDHRLVGAAITAYERTVAQARKAGVAVERLAWLDFDADAEAEYERLRRESSEAARSSEWATALALADRAVALAPWKREALEDRARLKAGRGDKAGAVEDVTTAIQCDFRPELLELRARWRRNKEDSLRAIADATVHLEFEPGSAPSWLNRGSEHMTRLEFDLAARNLAHVEAGPRLAHAKWFEVLAYLGMREPDRACAVLDSDEKLRESSGVFRAYFHEARAVANFAVGRFDAAVADCTAALQVKVDIRHLDHHPRVMRAIVRQEKGEWDKAARDLTARLAREPRSRAALVYAAYGVWKRDGRDAAARFVGERLSGNGSDDSLAAVARCVAGEVSLEELARRARAAESLEACRLYYHLGRIQELSGDAEAAAGSFAAAAAIDAGPVVEYWAAVRRAK